MTAPGASRFLGLSLLLTAAIAHGASFDALRLKMGRFHYVDTQNGKKGSASTCTIRPLERERFRFTCDFPAFEQSWSTIATRLMAPQQTELTMRTRDGARYRMDLSYAGHRVKARTAIQAASAEASAVQTKQEEAPIPPDTVDQRIDWATVMTTTLGPGKAFSFNVYDAKTGTSRVHCSIRDAGQLRTPLGDVRGIRLDYRVDKASGSEEYTVFASRDPPRIMLREDLPGGLTSTLVAME